MICKECGKGKHHAKGLCRKCYDKENRVWINKRSMEWCRRNKESIRLRQDIRRYGRSRFEILDRDGWKCQDCGMEIKEHMKKWNKSFDIHHVDGDGIYSKDKQNNDINNLITLCCSCHCARDNRMRPKKKKFALHAEGGK